MFFNISQTNDPTFPNNKKLGNFVINHDNGWSIEKNFLYKGYNDNGLLIINNEEDIDRYKSVEGNFCIIHFKEKKLNLISGRRQKFPIFQNTHNITNLYKSNDTYTGNISITENNEIIEDKETFKFKNLNLSDDQIIKKIDELIHRKVTSCFFDTPLKIFITGGLDTLLLAAYVIKNKIPYELIDSEHAEMDHFTCYHRNYILKNFWAYGTIQHWKTKSVLLTGSHGDEMMLRNAIQAKIIFDFHNEDLLTTINSNKEFYHKQHFLKHDNLKSYESLENLHFENEFDLKNHIMDIFSRDYQHWHLGNTLFFSPLNDIEILNLFLNLSYESAKNQLLDGEISKQLIEMNRPGLLKLLSDQKNHDYFHKTADLFENRIQLENL